MKTLSMTLAFLAALPLAAAAQVTKEDIKKLTAAGISDDVILSYVKANGPISRLSAEDVIELKQAGTSEKVLSMILAAPAPAPAAAPATTTVVNTTPYYYNPSPVVYDSGYSSYPASYSYSAYASTYPTYYYPRSYYYPSYYYPRYYSSYCYPRSSFSVGWSSRGYHSSRGSFGVSSYRR